MAKKQNSRPADMSWNKNIDQDRKRASRSRNADDSTARIPSNRLPARTGRRASNRPPVDPDLERFLTSADQSFASSAPDSVDDPIEVIIPEEIQRSYPKWRSLDDTDSDTARPSRAPKQERVHQVVHVPNPEPLFPGIFPGQDRDDPDSEQVMRVLFRRFPIFLLVAIIIWSLMAVYLSVVPPTFESSTTLLVDTHAFADEIDDLPRMNAASSRFGSGKLANQTLILQTSPELAKRTASQLSSIRAESPNVAKWTIFVRHTEQARSGGTLASLLTREYVTVQGGSSDDDEPDAISISVSSTDPAEAALIANVYSQTYVSEVDQLVSGHFQETLDYYNQRRDTKQLQVEDLTEELKVFIRADGALVGDGESEHILEQIAALKRSLDTTEIAIEEMKAFMASLDTEVSLMGGQLVAERAAHGIEDQLDQTYERIARLNIETERFYVKNPELRSDPTPSKDLTDMIIERSVLQIQADSLSQMYSDAITAVGGVDLRSYDGAISYMASLRRDLIKTRVSLDAAVAKHAATLIRIDEYETIRRNLPERVVEYKDISSRHENAVEQLNDLDDKIRRVEESADARRTFVRILNPAMEPTKPKTDPMLIAILGIILGLMGGVGAAFASEKMDSRLYEKSEIERYDVDVIASIPKFRGVARKTRRVFYERKISSEMVTILHPNSSATRSLHSIPLRIAGNTLRNSVFVFTGIDPKSGTSFLAANTAATIARSGARVLLVDANVSSPAVVNMLGLSDQARFDMSSGAFSDGKGIEAFSSRIPRLYALALEAPSGHNAEFLLSNNLVQFVQRVRKQFDAVIVDTASLTRSTTSLALSRYADEMVVVVRSGITKGKHLEDMLDDIRSSAGSRARVVLNGYGKMKAATGIPSISA